MAHQQSTELSLKKANRRLHQKKQPKQNLANFTRRLITRNCLTELKTGDAKRAKTSLKTKADKQKALGNSHVKHFRKLLN